MKHRFIFFLLMLVLSPMIFAQVNGDTRQLNINRIMDQGVESGDYINSDRLKIIRFLPQGESDKTGNLEQTFYVDTVYVFKTSEQQRVIYNYNSEGRITETLTQKLNSGQWVNFQRISNIFYSGSNILSNTYEAWQNNQWIIQNRTTVTYNLTGQAVQRLYEQIVSNQLTNSSRTIYEYNNNFLVSTLSQIWQSNAWVNNSRSTIINDGYGNRLTETQEIWQNSGWVYTQRFLSTYDVNSNLLSKLTEVWDTNWKNGFRDTYTYDNMNMLTSLDEKWDNNANNWVGQFRYSYNYNSANKILQQTQEVYQYIQWVFKDRYTNTYDINQNLTSSLYEAWLGNQWSNWGLNTYTYGNNKLLSKTYQSWSNGNWENNWKQNYEYNPYNNLNKGYYFTWSNSSWNPTDGSLIFKDDFNNNFGFYAYQISVSYKSSVGLEENISSEIMNFSLSQNYPNPFNPTTKISYSIPQKNNASIKIFNLLGGEAAELVNGEIEAGSHDIEFNASNLSSGVYFYQLKTGSFIDTKKMLLLK